MSARSHHRAATERGLNPATTFNSLLSFDGFCSMSNRIRRNLNPLAHPLLETSGQERVSPLFDPVRLSARSPIIMGQQHADFYEPECLSWRTAYRSGLSRQSRQATTEAEIAVRECARRTVQEPEATPPSTGLASPKPARAKGRASRGACRFLVCRAVTNEIG